MREQAFRVVKEHPLAWVWEPLEADPGFLVRPMFGGKAVYLDHRLVLFLSARDEPWNGLLVCTDRERQAALQAEWTQLAPHPILPKWLYLSQDDEGFERIVRRIVEAVRRRDGRVGVDKSVRRRGRSGARRRF